MPSALLEQIAPPPLESLPRKKWTRAEIGQIDAMGIFADQHYELIEGELINKMARTVSRSRGSESPVVVGSDFWLLAGRQGRAY
jgi:hypothetical protein